MTRRWPCVMFSQRPDFGVQFASPNIEELTGISAGGLGRRPQLFWQLVHEADAAELQQQCKRAAQTGQAVTNTYRIRHALTGRVAYILEGRQPAISRNGLLLGFEVVWLDVTRQTIAERRLSTAAWKETLAVLTLGMAHDFTNIIAGIHSLSEQFLEQATRGASVPRRFGADQEEFPPGQPVGPAHGQSPPRPNRRAQLSQPQRHHHRLGGIDPQDPAPPHPGGCGPGPVSLPVHLDVVEFRQVVINLLLNAADAMPKGGLLTLSTSRHETMPEVENLKGVAPRLPCVCLTIEDTGCGIKQRHLASIFDPFFTTKAKGSGLGLYNARLAVEKQQGAISVKSPEGVGHDLPNLAAGGRLVRAAGRKRRPRRGDDPPQPPAPRAGRGNAGQDRRVAPLPQFPCRRRRGLRKPARFAPIHAITNLPAWCSSPNRTIPASVPSWTKCASRTRASKSPCKLAGCNQDDLDTQFLSKIDLVLAADLSGGRFCGPHQLPSSSSLPDL